MVLRVRLNCKQLLRYTVLEYECIEHTLHTLLFWLVHVDLYVKVLQHYEIHESGGQVHTFNYV